MKTFYSRWLTLAIGALFAGLPMFAQEDFVAVEGQLLHMSDAEIRAANDSILSEAYRLYLAEKVSWTMEDIFFEKCPRKQDFHGWFQYPDSTVYSNHGIFYNAQNEVIYEISWNMETGNIQVSDTLRAMSESELSYNKIRLKCLNAVSTLEGVGAPPSGTNYSYEAILLDENLIRVYVFLGTTQHGVIPFGSDFSYDCDFDGNVLAFRKYHNASILAPTKVDGNPVLRMYHSHVDFCPLIAPTDIALFLLYGYELGGLDRFSVYSPSLNLVFTFNTNDYSISYGPPEWVALPKDKQQEVSTD